MEIKILKGAEEIGGNCIQISLGGQSIFLDAGIPLSEIEDPNPELIDFESIKKDTNILAIFLSHAHADHYGSLKNVSNIPIYMGEPSLNILKTAQLFYDKGINLENVKTFKDKEEIKCGPFTVIPYLIDHSVYDAHAFYITDGKKSIFYTADIRFTGRKRYMTKNLYKELPKIDVLLAEGTNIASSDDKRMNEEDLIPEMVDFIKGTEGLSLIAFSSINIDRLVTAYKAALKAGREILTDLYTLEILRNINNKNIPNGTWKNVHLFLNYSQKRKVKNDKLFDILEPYKKHRRIPETIAKNPQQYVLFYKGSYQSILEENHLFDKSSLIYSMWRGYFEKDKIQKSIKTYNIPYKFIHISGHTSKKDLEEFINHINPEVIIPVHTANPEEFESFEKVKILKNGEVMEV